MTLVRGVGFGRAWLVGGALYALVLLGSPLFHHDLDCHLKSPSHCQACVANPLAPRIESGEGLGALALSVAGVVERPRAEDPRSPCLVRLPGRSPPA